VNVSACPTGVTYRVLRLDGDYGPRYLLRSQSGDLVDLYPYGAEPMRFVGQREPKCCSVLAR